jgi:hypothetical protein
MITRLNPHCFNSLAADCADLSRRGHDQLSPQHPLADEIRALPVSEFERLRNFVEGFRHATDAVEAHSSFEKLFETHTPATGSSAEEPPKYFPFAFAALCLLTLAAIGLLIRL